MHLITGLNINIKKKAFEFYFEDSNRIMILQFIRTIYEIWSTPKHIKHFQHFHYSNKKKIYAHLRNLPHPKWRSLAPSNGIAEQGPGC